VAGSFGHDSEPSGSVKDREFLYQLSDHQRIAVNMPKRNATAHFSRCECVAWRETRNSNDSWGVGRGGVAQCEVPPDSV
jgi:hypothetical protein